MGKERKKALVVDDEPGVASLFKDILSEYNFEVEVVDNGVKAYEYLKKNDYDLVITDMKMPLLNGRKLYQKIKDEKLINPRKVILTSGDVLGYDTMEFMGKEKVKFLVKPFKIKEFLNLIDRVLKENF
jgi:DNA-binding response OmpR family regulator